MANCLIRWLIIIIFWCIVFMVAPWAWAQPPEERIQGEELGSFMVRIEGINELIPKEARVRPGTTVIWLNVSSAKGYFELYFTGKQVEVACKSPTRFHLHPEGGFYSDRIPPGSVASLCFVEKGKFEYTVVPKSFPFYTYKPGPGAREIKGTIIVE